MGSCLALFFGFLHYKNVGTVSTFTHRDVISMLTPLAVNIQIVKAISDRKIIWESRVFGYKESGGHMFVTLWHLHSISYNIK